MSTVATTAWRQRLRRLLEHGQRIESAGVPALELPVPEPYVVSLREPLALSPARRPSFRFAAAEALWILSGDDRAASIGRYTSALQPFSDDGEHLFGAYGPPIRDQLPYVVRQLVDDPESRRAWLTIWRQNPPETTRDTPCTLALGWTVRGHQLSCTAYMRSSDAFTGLLYDPLVFAVVTAWVRHELETVHGRSYDLGELYLIAASSHLYERDVGRAQAVLDEPYPGYCQTMPLDFARVAAGLRVARESASAYEVRHEPNDTWPWRFWEAQR